MPKKEYKVVALSVSGKGNNIYKARQVVDGSKFNNVDELVKKGFIVLCESEAKKEKVEKSEKKESPKK